MRFQTQLLLRIIAHFAIGIIFGYLYRGVGSDASQILSNMVFIYGTNLFLVYTGQMAVIVSCKCILLTHNNSSLIHFIKLINIIALLSFLFAVPLEYKVLKREHFNGWYTLFPYMISILLVEIPFQVRLHNNNNNNNDFTVAVSLDSVVNFETGNIFPQILCCLIYLVPSYVMTGQPLDLMRFSYFTIFAIVTSLTSQSTGFLYGATLPVKVSF